MLVLSRRPLEEIVLETSDGRVTVGITDVQGDKVRLAIAAPAAVVINRREVADRIAQERGSGDR